MSKMDALRAMREANYAANQRRTSSPAAAARPKAAEKPAEKQAEKPAPKAASKASPKASPVVETDAEESAEELCGHRNMSGRTCTREKGHAAKSHRYS